jgi:hypothetical protein
MWLQAQGLINKPNFVTQREHIDPKAGTPLPALIDPMKLLPEALYKVPKVKLSQVINTTSMS